MIAIVITPLQIKKSKTWYSFTCLNNSITKGAGNEYGALGEIVFEDYMKSIGCRVEHIAKCRDYDFVVDGKKVEVKTAKTTTKPLDTYAANVSTFSAMQNCDDYYFIRVLADKSLAYVLGWLPKAEYFKKAKFYRKGDFEIGTKFVKTEDSYSVMIKDLNPVWER